MKRLANIIAVAGLVATPAFAADLPVKAPPPPPPPPTWTGWYVGGNVGYSWGNAHTETLGLGSGFTNCVVGLNLCHLLEEQEVLPIFPFNTSFVDARNQRLSGVIGGIQGGYNYQIWNVWVLGWEADLQGSGERGTNSFLTPFSAVVCDGFFQAGGGCATHGLLTGTSFTSLEAKIDWFGTVRMRGGVLFGDSVMLYATGGAAYGGVSASGAYSVASLPGSFPSVGPSLTAFSNSKFNVGWTLGGGVEGRFLGFAPNWSWKVEYLYVDLGWAETNTPFIAASNTIFAGPLTGTVRTNTHFTDNVVRVGVNYHFGVPGAPY
jgi:outer membrane immunogenic protein